ncbi:uncharacterized protein CELE_K09F5.4 [Caenorhabditis elegans]|uniref:Secreted protein n=1 Tax=Caenorhabditis elegans TaxID=6239 RepID=Q21402_CAEEL|nr:Secreted protein [Caenorhabditis elegans]CCD67567.2 Secreted protein [Caenorhabditis elegans]
MRAECRRTKMEKEGAHNTIINSEMRSTEKSEKRPPPFGMNMFFFSIPLKAMFLFFACMIPTGHQGWTHAQYLMSESHPNRDACSYIMCGSGGRHLMLILVQEK